MSNMERPAPGATGNRAGGNTRLVGQRPFTNTRSENQAPLRQSVANQALPPRMQLVAWRPVNGGKLRGRASVLLPSGLKINGVCVFRTDRGMWATLPSEAMRDASGNLIKDGEGKTRYRSTIQWATRELQSRWSDAVVRLITDEYGSGAFDGDSEGSL